MKILKSILVSLFFAAAVIGCIAQKQNSNTPSYKPAEQLPINRSLAIENTNLGSVTRVLSFGDLLPRALWNDPSVIKENGNYIMFATANLGGKWGTVLPFRATSNDGLKWEIENRPLLQLGAKGSFDEDSVETPSVVKFQGKYHMFYTGIVKGILKKSMAIGHAVSDDGVNWEKVSDKPLLKPTGNFLRDWNGYHVAEPGAVVFNNKLYLYFHASGRRDGGGKPGNMSSIGLSISSDGYEFTEMRRILTQGPRYPTTAPEVFVGYSTPSAEVVDGKVHLFYDVIATKPSWTQVALHHAVASDGVNFKEDSQPLLTRDDLSWTKTSIRAPSTLYEAGRFRLWFAGHNIDNLPVSGVGYMDWKPPQ